MSGCLIRIAQFCAMLYFGINWGTTHAQSTGGKAVMSFIGMLAIALLFSIVEILVRWLQMSINGASHKATYGSSRSSYAYGAPSEEARERALDSIVARTKGNQGSHAAPGPPRTAAQPLSREEEAERLQERIRRAADEKPIQWG